MEGIAALRQSLFDYFDSCGIPKEVADCSYELFIADSINATLLRSLFDAKLKEGDTVLLPLPAFGRFFDTLDSRGLNIGLEYCGVETEWKMTPDKLRNFLTRHPEAKIYIFVHPDNPTGIIYTKEEMEGLAEVFIEHNTDRERLGKEPLIIVTDEIARNIILNEEAVFVSLASIPGMRRYTYTITSVSKDLAPGIALAIGYGPEELISRIRTESSPSYSSQCAVAAAFAPENRDEFLAHCRRSNDAYAANLNLVKSLLLDLSEKFDGMSIPFSIVSEPKGGFQLLIQMKGCLSMEFPENYTHIPNPEQREICSSLDLAWYIRETAKVEFIPGEGFGFSGEDIVFRMTLSKRQETYISAFQQIGEALGQLGASKPTPSANDPTLLKGTTTEVGAPIIP
jgi:aspartate aminotransferase